MKAASEDKTETFFFSFFFRYLKMSHGLALLSFSSGSEQETRAVNVRLQMLRAQNKYHNQGHAFASI